MSKVLKRVTAALAVMIASLAFATSALAQMPTSPWKKGAPFPEPDEELYGVTVNGKLYVMGGWDNGKARGANYEYDPATDKWTKKSPMPRPAHHAALAAQLAELQNVPQVTRSSYSSNRFSVSVDYMQGVQFSLYRSSALSSNAWKRIPSVSQRTNFTVTLTDANALEAANYYRVSAPLR
jgi:hypothetical protein